MGRTVNRRKILEAQIAGIAARYAQRQAIDEPEALAEIAECLTQNGVKAGSSAAVEVLTATMALFFYEDLPLSGWYYPEARRLLTAACGDPDKARAQARPPQAFQVGDGGRPNS